VSLRVRLFWLAHRAVTRSLLALQAVHQGLWLGLLEGADLHAATARFYRLDARRYGGLEHDTGGLLGWEADLLLPHLRGCRSVLVGAAGGGRELLALAGLGFAVEGFDCAPALVEAAERLLRSAGVVAPVRLAAPDRLPEGLGTYDAVILGFGGYTHVATRAARIALLQGLARHLRPGGPLVVTFQVRPREPRGQRVYRWTWGTARLVRALRRSRIPVELGDVLPGYFAHRFSRAEIEAELAAAGLALVHYADREYGAAVARDGRAASPASPDAAAPAWPRPPPATPVTAG
jgi:SAM-dependent methyltransferase